MRWSGVAVLCLTILGLLGDVPAAHAQTALGTAFTYQGRLVEAGFGANGTYDLQMILFEAAVGGSQVGPIVVKDNVAVTNGLFTVTLDFGAVFGASKRFLEVGVRPGASSGAYTSLSPRQELTPGPSALFSMDAATIGGLACSNGQVPKWNGATSVWACGNDIDTDTNSGGDITDVTAGNGLTGGGSAGTVTIDAGAGTGIVVGANTISLDTAFTDARYDPRYVNSTGDTMSGTLNMNQNRVTNRSCPAAYVRAGPGLCTEFTDASGFNFNACANRCRIAGTHMCSSAEMHAVILSLVALDVGGVLLDWVDDQDAVGSALFVNNASTDPNVDGFAARATSTASFCRCCANVE